MSEVQFTDLMQAATSGLVCLLFALGYLAGVQE